MPHALCAMRLNNPVRSLYAVCVCLRLIERPACICVQLMLYSASRARAKMKPEIIRKIAVFFQDRPEVNAVYVFGSYARGREQKGSDLDLAILLDYGVVRRLNELKKEYVVHLSRILRKDLHLVILNNAGEEVVAQVFKYGQCIFNREPEILSRFKMVSYAMIAEFAYHRNLMKKGFIHGLFGESH